MRFFARRLRDKRVLVFVCVCVWHRWDGKEMFTTGAGSYENGEVRAGPQPNGPSPPLPRHKPRLAHTPVACRFASNMASPPLLSPSRMMNESK